jgi:flavin reductase (DIM6/NTAB) family NADH-FMN oxidoreductase RutF
MTVDQAIFRAVLAVVPTSVVVVTGISPEGNPVGATIGSFTSVSLNPPMVGFLPSVDMEVWKAMKSTGKFCVNVLTGDQEKECWAFAGSKDDRFAGISWKKSPAGLPQLDGVAAWIDCQIHSETLVGDHYFVAGTVLHMGANDAAKDSMIFYRNAVGVPNLGK